MRSLFRSRTFVLLSLVCVFFASSAFGAVQYTIRKGDTLDSIAKKHHVSLKELRQANNVSPKHMKPGGKIVIPVKASAAVAGKKKSEVPGSVAQDVKAKKQAEEASEPETSADSRTRAVYHTVRKGDTLSSISRKYSLTTADLKELNNLHRNKLLNGQKLLVNRVGPRTYTVRKGDNIWKIAKKYDMDADDLMALNEMDTPDLKVGRKLYLEEAVDASSAETYKEALGRNIEDEIRKLSESEEFREQDQPDKLAIFAKKMINIPYRFGGNSILGIDCSAYVKKVYGFMGIELPRTAREQFKEGEKIDREELSIGDLVFFRTYASFPSHVGIYLGNNLFIHASSKGKRVTIDSLDTPYYLKRFIGGKRVLTEAEKEPGQQG
ncbi:MAG: LysM peptidoglycan-binding domain-containing protein [Nitrospiraceae bacterium]|nr:LysM peptidoglycan-binding domain-containing protein [Nitrospiraceae bacterium]